MRLKRRLVVRTKPLPQTRREQLHRLPEGVRNARGRPGLVRQPLGLQLPGNRLEQFEDVLIVPIRRRRLLFLTQGVASTFSGRDECMLRHARIARARLVRGVRWSAAVYRT